ncbi:MAG: BatD family protein [Pseudomonadota bacterium]
MKPTGKLWRAMCALFIMISADLASAAVTATLDRQSAALGDTLRLTISADDGEDLDQIDLSPLSSDFEILQRSTSSKTSYVNGEFTSTQEILLDIAPRREGSLFVPAFRVGQTSTNPIPVAVSERPQGAANDQVVVFEAELDRSSVYVQGQLILTLRLQQAINLDDRSITELQLDNAFVRPLEQNSFQRTVDGRPWLVHEVRYAIFPEQSGTLTVPPQTFSARESTPRRSLFDRGSLGRQIRRSTEALTIEVLPRPADYPAGEWLPAREVTAEESWSTDPQDLEVGDSATRIITFRGEGLQGAQLPPVMYPATAGVKYYPDQPSISDSESAAGLIGTRVDSVAVVPTQSGKWLIPELRVPWWNTETNELQYAVLPAREIDVAPGSVAASPPTPQAIAGAEGLLTQESGAPITVVSQQSSQRWQIIALINGIGWIGTIAYLVWSRTRNAAAEPKFEENVKEPAAFKALLQACSDGDSVRARQAVIQWARALTGREDITALAQVSSLFDNRELVSTLRNLNSAIYGEDKQSWDGTALAEGVRKERAEYQIAQRSQQRSPLQLYPQSG